MEQAAHQQVALPKDPAADQILLRQHQLQEPAPPNYITPFGMRREEFRAMGTTITLLLPESKAEMGAQIVRTLFSEWEQTLSRFLPESEISQLNQQEAKPVAISDLLYHVLATALEAAQATNGVYDPALLEQLVQLGYDRTFDDLPTVRFDPIIPGEPGGRWRGIKIDPIRHHVTLPAGIKLDFGGIAKGMAVDAALERLSQQDISYAMVNAGGDLSVRGLPPTMEQWLVAVPGPKNYWTIPLHHGAIATSGIAHRHWWQGNTLRHHILDPSTGMPAQNDLWSVTVVADHCEQAEVAAKVAFILGSKSGAEFLSRHRIAGLLIRENGTWETVEPWPKHLMEEISI